MSPDKYADLRRNLYQQNVLSVYISAEEHDPTQRTTWRMRLKQHLDTAETGLEGDSREEFRAARRLLEVALQPFTGFLPGRGWSAFVTAENVWHCGEEPAPMPDVVRWRRGPLLGPVLRGAKQSRDVLVILIDSRRARVLKYRGGELDERVDERADAFIDDLTDRNMSKRAATSSGVRGETATDAAERILRVEMERLVKQVADDVRGSPAETPVILGGPTVAVTALHRQLEPQFGDRLHVDATMELPMTHAQLLPLVEAAASGITARLHEQAVRALLEAASPAGLGGLGPAQVASACTLGQVERLLLTPAFMSREEEVAEELIARTLEQGGAIELVSGEGARLLDESADGVAARLRFVLHAPSELNAVVTSRT
jgi:hypothetical protein